MANNRYEPELKEKVLRLYLEEGRTKKSLTEEYNLGQGAITYHLRRKSISKILVYKELKFSEISFSICNEMVIT